MFFILVFISHGCAYHAPELTTHWLAPVVQLGVIHNGALVLSFFFVMSAFLITLLLLREQQASGRISVGSFYLRRLLRIWPLYAVVLLYGFVGYPWLRAMGRHPHIETAIPWHYLLCVQNWDIAAGHVPRFAPLFVTWSVAIEEQFYLLWPVVLVLVPPRRLVAVLSLLLAGTIGWQAVYGDVLFHSMTCASDLLIGSLLAVGVFLAQQYRLPWARWWLVRMVHMPRLFTIGLWIWALYLYRHGLSEAPAALKPFERLTVDLTAALVMLEQNYGRHSLFKLGRVPAFRRLGQLAYGLYLLHYIAIVGVADTYHMLHLHKTVWDVVVVMPLLSFGLAVGGAMLSFRYFELPFLRSYARLKVMLSALPMAGYLTAARAEYSKPE
ncbi:hypothetical protein GCM10027594_31120 [Hymenobacter agri]